MSWAKGSWGFTAWGGGDDDELIVNAAIAISENIVRIEFNQAPFYSGVLDPHDASNTHRYTITSIPGTMGLDGNACRPVFPAEIREVAIAGGEGRFIDVVVDRPFSPYPAQYRVSVNNLISQVSSTTLSTTGTSALFFGLLRGVVEDNIGKAVISPDIASPQTKDSLKGLPEEMRHLFGGFAIDDSKDFATDDGNVQRQKRVLRRLFTEENGFLHLPGYGLGLSKYLKTLNQAAKRSEIISKATKLLLKEPDFSKVLVDIFNGHKPGIVFLRVLVKTIDGVSFKVQTPLKLS